MARVDREEAGVAADNKPALKAIGYQSRRVKDAYLLSELAAEGFLPGYGFPTGITPLVTTLRQAEIAMSGSARTCIPLPGLPQPGSSTSRSSNMAPGASVVLDGLVYVSSGITVNWQSPASVERVREIQALRTAWRCRRCGAAGVTSTAARPDVCSVCGSSSFDCRDHIAPKGFAVDIRQKPHDDTLS